METLSPIEKSKQFNRTRVEQQKIEDTIAEIFMQVHLEEQALPDDLKGTVLKEKSTLGREKTAIYLSDFLKNHTLTQGFENQKTWVIFFLLYGLDLLGEKGCRFDEFSEYLQLEICHYLGKFWNEDGKQSILKGHYPLHYILNNNFKICIFEKLGNFINGKQNK